MLEIYESETIYSLKTREYFKEVLSSYYNGNYRSAVVMLYSVAVCDLLYKLQELRDMYNDTIAQTILAEIDKCRKQENGQSKSQWEKDLIESIHSKTEILDDKSYSDLLHLFDDRNFSAHPALNGNYELIMPSREATVAHIKNTLDNILSKPPIFAKNIIDMLTEDLADKKEILIDNKEQLRKYLNQKYFDRMSIQMKKKVFRALWKFCFKLPDDQNCMENITINRKALEILYIEIDGIIEFIKSDSMFTDLSNDEKCIGHLCVFLSHYPELYSVLKDHIKLLIDEAIKSDSTLYLISWFKSDKKTHISNMITESTKNSYSADSLNYMKRQYEVDGLLSLFLDFTIEHYGTSWSFDSADARFDSAIRPSLNEFSREQFIKLITVSNSNDQLYRRNRSLEANNAIVKCAKSILGDGFEFEEYPHFKFSKSLLSEPTEVDNMPFSFEY